MTPERPTSEHLGGFKLMRGKLKEGQCAECATMHTPPRYAGAVKLTHTPAAVGATGCPSRPDGLQGWWRADRAQTGLDAAAERTSQLSDALVLAQVELPAGAV